MSSGSFGFVWVHSSARSGPRVHSVTRAFTQALKSRELNRGRLGVVAFIRGCVGSIGLSKGSSGSFVFAWVHSSVPSCLRVRPGSCGFTRARGGNVGLIRVRVGSLRPDGSSGSFGFAYVHSCATMRRVH